MLVVLVSGMTVGCYDSARRSPLWSRQSVGDRIEGAVHQITRLLFGGRVSLRDRAPEGIKRHLPRDDFILSWPALAFPSSTVASFLVWMRRFRPVGEEDGVDRVRLGLAAASLSTWRVIA